MDAAIIVSNVAVIITSTNIGLVGANVGLISVVEAGASELKLIVPIIFSSSCVFNLTAWCSLNCTLFVGCTFKQLTSVVYTSLRGLNLT